MTLPVVVRGRASTNDDRLGDLVAGEVGGDVVLDLLGGQLGARPFDDVGPQALTELLVAHTDDGDLDDRPGGRPSRSSTSAREDVLAARHDHVVVAPVDEQPARCASKWPTSPVDSSPPMCSLAPPPV